MWLDLWCRPHCFGTANGTSAFSSFFLSFFFFFSSSFLLFFFPLSFFLAFFFFKHGEVAGLLLTCSERSKACTGSLEREAVGRGGGKGEVLRGLGGWGGVGRGSRDAFSCC